MNEHATNRDSQQELTAMAERVQQTLAGFDIKVTIGEVFRGPSFTRFEVFPGRGVRIDNIFVLGNDLAAEFKTECSISGPVPGKGCLAIDVANAARTNVFLRDLWNSEEWSKAEGQLPIPLGKDVYNRMIIADLAAMPHLLIAGRTGSGKTVFIDALITSLLHRFSPEHVRFVMIDLNIIELQHYTGLPHLIGPVVIDRTQAPLALQWVVNEIYNRYETFARTDSRNLTLFNERLDKKISAKREGRRFEKIVATSEGFVIENNGKPSSHEKSVPQTLPRIVVVVNEPTELMLAAPGEIELAISRIAQMGRAVGIHLVIATRNPSVDIITSEIKANVPARIAFQVGSRTDSRTILEVPGGEMLLGKGDMLYLAPDSHKLQRIQAPLITDLELMDIVQPFRAAKDDEPATNLQKP